MWGGMWGCVGWDVGCSGMAMGQCGAGCGVRWGGSDAEVRVL